MKNPGINVRGGRCVSARFANPMTLDAMRFKRLTRKNNTSRQAVLVGLWISIKSQAGVSTAS